MGLAARSDLSQPRHWVHYLWCTDPSDAQAVVEHVARAGWGIQRAGAAFSEPLGLLIAEQHDVVVTAARVRSARAFFEAVAAGLPGGS